MTRTRENSAPAQAGVVRVSVAKFTPTAGFCAAVIGNTNVTKLWTPRGITIDCSVLRVGLQRKSPRRENARSG
jgi:hypothetical protein